jgi:formylglycine-generating enzyme required for sulfatase activity
LRQVNGLWEVKIIDFGLSRVATSLKHEAMAKSRSGKSMFMQEVFGTLDYAPPEQLGDIRHGRPGPHSDIFSFGATLYRLLSGESPRIINSRCLPDSAELRDVLIDCLMAEQSRRPSSASELVRMLERMLADARLTPTERYRQYLSGKLREVSVIESEEEDELAWDGNRFGLNRKEAKGVLSQVMGELSVRSRREEPKVPWSQVIRNIDLYRPSCLPERISRNEVLELMPGPHNGGSLVQLPDLPSGLRRKVILARDCSPLLEMVEIPSGKFLMGSSDRDPYVSASGSTAFIEKWKIEIGARVKKTIDTCFKDTVRHDLIPNVDKYMENAINYFQQVEKPQREVYLNTYWIARTPVTNRIWQKFLQESGYQPAGDDHNGDYLKHWKGKKPPADKLDHPVVYLSYIAVWAFCDYYGLMLPSEAQWEKAARVVDGRIYPWGDQQPTPELCNFSGSGIGNTTPVGKYPDGISPFGLVDCAGNVWEWCADEYSENWLQELDPNNGRVICLHQKRTNWDFAIRGGSFSDGPGFVRCAFRNAYTAAFCGNDIGFRPAQDEAL